MSKPLDVFDPELDNIIVDVIWKAYGETLNNRSNLGLNPGNRSNRLTNNTNNLDQADSIIPSRTSPSTNKDRALVAKAGLAEPRPLAELRQTIIPNVLKRLEKHFDETNKPRIITADQMRQIEQRCNEHLKNLYEQNLQKQNESNRNASVSQQNKSNLNKLLTATLMMIGIQYSYLAMAKQSALKKLKKAKLLAAYKKRRRKLRQLAEEQARTQEQEQEQAKQETPEEAKKREKEYRKELELLFGDLVGGNKDFSEEEITAAAAAVFAIENSENLGDNIHDAILDLHRDLELPGMDPKAMEQFKEDFKKAILEINTTLINQRFDKAPEASNKASEQVFAEVYAKFEEKVLGPLHKFRENASVLISKGTDTAKKIPERMKILENRFSAITKSLTSWARGEPILRKKAGAEQSLENVAENKVTAEGLAVEGPNAAAAEAQDQDFNTPEAIARMERARAAAEALAARNADSVSLTSQFATARQKAQPAPEPAAPAATPDTPAPPDVETPEPRTRTIPLPTPRPGGPQSNI